MSPSLPADNVRGRMASGAAWMVAFKLLERSIGLVSTLILARLLVPADFGLVAMATAFVAVLELMGAWGFDVSLIQNPEAERRHFDTAWTMNVLVGLACGALLVLLAWPAAAFYNEARLAPVMLCLGLASAVQGFENIGVVAFRKQLRFDREFRYLLGKRLSAFVVTVILAFAFRSYWALVLGILAGRSASVALSYYVHEYRPRFSLAAAHEMLRFSSWLFLNNIIFFANTRAADFIVGRLAGAQSLGLYSVANEIATLPTTELVAPINRAVFPGYARMSADREQLRQGFLDVLSVIVLCALPAGLGIAATAPALVPVVLGPKWLDAVPLIQILACYGAVHAMLTNSGSVFMATGQPRILTGIAGLQSLIALPLLILLCSRYGVTGAAWSFVIAILIVAPLCFWLVLRHLEMRVKDLAGIVWRPAFAAGAMVVAVLAVQAQLPGAPWFGGALVTLIAQVISGAVVYVVVVMSLWRLAGCPQGAERFALDTALGALHRLGIAPCRSRAA